MQVNTMTSKTKHKHPDTHLYILNTYNFKKQSKDILPKVHKHVKHVRRAAKAAEAKVHKHDNALEITNTNLCRLLIRLDF